MSKIFVAGATGVLGRRAVARLVVAGHEVTGVARSDEKAELLRALGATPVAVDLFDATAVKGAVDGHDVVANLATHIPSLSKAALPGAWSENDRLRGQASEHLVDGALATGASRYIQESISFMYADAGDRWIDEDGDLDQVSVVRSTLAAEGQARRFTEAGGAGVVLRFGQFYAPEAVHTVAMAKAARRRIAPALGPKDSYLTTIAADDAATAVVASLAAPAGVYNVTDDDPMTRRAFAEAVARALGTKPPRTLPQVLGKLGGEKGRFYMRSQRVSNRRFKEATGWAPAHPRAAEGWAAMATELKDA
jgi:nucleoside-diphosphate-sugar epimerase